MLYRLKVYLRLKKLISVISNNLESDCCLWDQTQNKVFIQKQQVHSLELIEITRSMMNFDCHFFPSSLLLFLFFKLNKKREKKKEFLYKLMSTNFVSA